MDKSKIKILPPDLVNKIAAGEVVERPASVVKELVENSIDAKATHITIEIQDAGKKFICVTDDGIGMAQDEIKLALERHSTSKISSLDDLFNLKSLGFRGEALPSIHSVSNMTIEQNPSGHGLAMKVKDLFHNIPVRLKFLKSNYTELGHIQNLVTRFILSNPEISFKLVVDGKEVLMSAGNGKLFDAIYSVYGLDIAKDLIEVKSDNVSGYVSKPTISRIDRGYESFFVNNRSINNFLLSRALEDAYRTLIPSNRYPIAVLFINIKPNEVDVNVHPSKREVKFLNNKIVMGQVREAVSAAMGKMRVGEGPEASMDIGLGSLDRIEQDQFPMTNNQTGIITLTPTPLTMEVTGISPLIPLYQLIDTYIIICTDGVDLVLIDQHAAHERVLFDQLTNRGKASSFQSLLIPETLGFNHLDSIIVEENLETIKEMGFDIEIFGKDSFILRSVPSFISLESPKEIFTDLISEFKDKEYKNQPEKRKERMNKYLACRGAVKAGDKLEIGEIQGLIRDLYLTSNPLTCPHGRPTMVRLTKENFEKMFGRT
ncbi:DNA mismatch repair endonuclease MutL [Candidatus Saganbacteria bacterium]|nr:DNA mismatch repair endonuclease MutL [Candidatus Saganbacteria bacterium]